MRVAALDLGTNTFLCLVAEVKAGKLKVISDSAKVVRLGEKVNENKIFLPAALQRAQTCLTEFRKEIDKHQVDKIIAAATSAARDVSNGRELLRICDALEIPLYIIEGKKEAELSFKGALSAVPDSGSKKVLVVDVGGGSTELIYQESKNNVKCQSFQLGSVRLTEMFIKTDPVNQKELLQLIAYSKEVMKEFGRVDPDLIVAVAGTPTTLACIEQQIDFNEQQVEGYVLKKKSIQKMVKELGGMPLSLRKNVKGLEPLRADVIVAGATLLELTLDLVGREEMRVSTRGLRYGVAFNYGEFL